MADATAKEESLAKSSSDKVRRKIPGNFAYTSSPGVLRRVLEKIPHAEKPGIFNLDFVGTVLGATGGASRPIPPILKSAGFLSQTGVPTELYAQFQTEGGRANAALQGLRNGYGEIFKRNTYAHRADESTLIDVIVSVTGLPKSDNIVRYILNTFQAFQAYAKNVHEEPSISVAENGSGAVEATIEEPQRRSTNAIALAYNINIVLPETTNIEIYNAIFKSIRGNLMQ